MELFTNPPKQNFRNLQRNRNDKAPMSEIAPIAHGRLSKECEPSKKEKRWHPQIR